MCVYACIVDTVLCVCVLFVCVMSANARVLCFCLMDGVRCQTNVYLLPSLGAGDCIMGPAIIIDSTSTILIEPGCEARITDRGDISIKVDSSSGTVLHRVTAPHVSGNVLE